MNTQKKNLRFVRREDLTQQDRFLMAYVFIFQKKMGHSN